MSHSIPSASQRYPKSMRLSSKKLIGELFSKGKVKRYKDFRFHYLQVPDYVPGTDQVLFSVPNKVFKKAVIRNRIKRLFRECYRINQAKLDQNTFPHLPYLLAYVYISSYLPVYKELEKQVIASIDYLIKSNIQTHEKKD